MIAGDSPDASSRIVALYARLAESSAALLGLARQERWDEFAPAETAMNELVRQLHALDDQHAELDETGLLLRTVYLKQVMADNEKTKQLVVQRAQDIQQFLVKKANTNRLDRGYSSSDTP
jgi:hypothetical protein